jgi:hypothetical protein
MTNSHTFPRNILLGPERELFASRTTVTINQHQTPIFVMSSGPVEEHP